MNLSLIGFFALQLNYILTKTDRSRLLFLMGFVGWGFLMLAYSSVAGNTPGNSFRFLIILILIQAAFFVKPNPKYIHILIGFLVLQSLFLIALHLVLNLFFNSSNYLFLRMFFQAQGWGDLYTYNGLFYNIQILGNALLPFGVFVSVVFYSGVKRTLLTLVLFTGMMVAGNFAFVLGVLVFIFFLFFVTKSFNTRKFLTFAILGILLGAIAAKPALSYLEKTISNKSQESNPTRIDQSKVLWEDLSENPLSLIFGQGLGNTLKVKTKWRDYTDNIYFELQSLYFLNQMGLLNFLIFFISNIICVVLFFKKPLVKIIYIAYILYAFFNPYFLDTSHIVVIITLISLNEVLEKRKVEQIPVDEV
ncbi:MAG: hypothetical protein PSV36_10150 [Algoriphagus sp.]|nr:hypothetical protein [Algoriphagus sp.]